MSITVKLVEVNTLSRPRKWRKVCCLPQSNLFGPLNARNIADSIITMSIEEYETIRLIDLQGFMQEEAAEQMNIARTTVQRIYNDARKKLAESLVNEKVLRIEGGDYRLCEGLENFCGCGGCEAHRYGGEFTDDNDGFDNKNTESEDKKDEDSNTSR
jgi:predicted DNA-binding protein (UPF0251 family)